MTPRRAKQWRWLGISFDISGLGKDTQVAATALVKGLVAVAGGVSDTLRYTFWR
jgi:hypothetical protein